jgi:ABC-2 type transport system ATP-binding protein
MVEFQAIGKDYGDLKALRDVSFSIPKGGIVGLLGPNGAGKTTAMRIMTGYMEPSRGKVRIAGEEFSPDSVHLKARIGYLPESAPVYGDMLAWDYLMYEAELHGLDPRTRVPETIREVGLESHAHKPIRELSKGFRQRVGLAHTLLHEPELLVLDEPTSGLDPNQIIEVRNLIRRIAETKTVILSTHIMQEVEALCSRVIVIHRGSIRYDGSITSFSPSSRKIHLSVAGVEYKKIEELLKHLEGFHSLAREETSAEVDENGEKLLHVSVLSASELDLRPEIFRIAAENGKFTIYEMVRERTSMEDIFHELTASTDTGIAATAAEPFGKAAQSSAGAHQKGGAS